MKTVHWSMFNGSGMHRVAESMARAELAAGVHALLLNPFDDKQVGWDDALDADVHINHTHLPEQFAGKSFRRQCTKPFKWVFPVHGTPELVFELAVRDAESNGYNTGTGFSHHQNGMQQADAIVTFWSRHQALYELATDKHTMVDLVPMGIDLDFWKNAEQLPKYFGTPSFLSCENAYPFKWSVELLRCWPWVRRALVERDLSPCLHVGNLPVGLQRFVDVLLARYGSIEGTVVGSWSYDHVNLSRILKQVDYYVSPVHYGDHNRMSLEASASGVKVISYPGNEYADFWMPEGDQREMAKALIAIASGEVAPRAKTPVPSEQDMARAMIHVYERILDRPQTNFALGGIPDSIPQVVIDALLSTLVATPSPATGVAQPLMGDVVARKERLASIALAQRLPSEPVQTPAEAISSPREDRTPFLDKLPRKRKSKKIAIAKAAKQRPVVRARPKKRSGR